MESQYPAVLRELLNNPTIRSARVNDAATDEFHVSTMEQEDQQNVLFNRISKLNDNDDMNDDEDDEIDDQDIQLFESRSSHRNKHVSFMIDQKLVQVCDKSRSSLKISYKCE